MSEMQSYPHGAPSCADLGARDVDAARDFYARVLGREYAAGPETPGSTHVPGARTAGRGHLPAGRRPTRARGAAELDDLFRAVEDADRFAEAVEEAGGRVLIGPMQVMQQSRALLAHDRSGAVFGAWQAGRHTGARIAREPSTMVWHELVTRDVEGAKAFHTRRWAWASRRSPTTYTMLTVDEQPVAGLMAMPDGVPADVPPYWTVYFDVEDADTAVGRAADAGGTVVSGPQDSPYGRLAFLQDRQGAAFPVIHSEPPGE